MTKQQFRRARGEITRAHRDPTFTKALTNASAKMLVTAWRQQRARLAKRSEITQQEIANFLL